MTGFSEIIGKGRQAKETTGVDCKEKLWPLRSLLVKQWEIVGFVFIPVELFQILKDGAMKVLHSICQQIWKTQHWPQDWKRSVFIPVQRKSMPKNAQTITQLHSSHTLAKLKILQARLQQYMNCELPDVQAGFKKAEEPELKLPTSIGLLKKQDSSRKTYISALLTMPNPMTVWITTNWKILKEMGMPDHLTCLLRNLYPGQEATVRTRHGQQTGFK